MNAKPQPGIYSPASISIVEGLAPRRALFLDRDGVINVDHGYVCSPNRTDWVPGIFELCEVARDCGYVIVIATNQAGIARGYFTESEFLEYTRWIHDEFAMRGVELLATVYCPHHPDAGKGEYRVACECRKPASGMFIAASRMLALAPGSSVMIGDKEGDLVAAKGAGVPTTFLAQPGHPGAFQAAGRYLREQASRRGNRK